MASDPLDADLRLVADRHRRQVIEHLRRDDDGRTTFEALVDHLHERGPHGTGDHVLDREQLSIRLQHTLLPTLSDHGVVEFDHRSGAVRYHPDEEVEALLDALPRDVSVSTT